MPSNVNDFLTVVFSLWLLPVAYTLTYVLHLKSLRKGIRPWLAELFHCEHPDLFAVRDEQMILEIKYQNMQSELISVRQAVAQSTSRQKTLREKFRIESRELEQAERRLSIDKDSRSLSAFIDLKRKELDSLECELELLDKHIESGREWLTKQEIAVQKAYANKQVTIAKLKGEAAVRVASKLLSMDQGAAYRTLRRMETKVVRKEAKIYGLFFLDDHFVCFPAIWKSVDKIALEALSLEELRTLLEELERGAAELHAVVTRAVAYEQSLELQIKSSKEEERVWEKRFADATKLARQPDVGPLWKRQLACSDITRQLIEMVDGSKICTAEFIRMHSEFARKERSIFNRIEHLERVQAEEPS